MSTDDLASSGRMQSPARLLAAGHNFGPAIGGIERLGDGLARHVAPGATTVVARTPANANASTVSEVAAFDAFDTSVPYRVVRRPLVGAVPPRWWAARRALRAELANAEYGAVLALEWWPEARALTSISPRPTSAVLVYGTELAQSLGRPRARRSMERALRSTDVVIAISAFTAELAAMVGVSATIVHPGVELDPPSADVAALARSLGVASRPVVLTTARLVERKGHADLLNVWPGVLARVPDAVWLVAGDGPERDRLQARAVPGVHFLGAVDDRTLAALYRLAHLHVLPGREIGGAVEGFGMAAVEAGAAGTPTIATDVGGTAEAVGPGGVVVPPGHPERVADAIADLLLDERTRADLGRQARSHAEQLAWPLVGARMRDALALDARATAAAAAAAVTVAAADKVAP